MSHFYTLFPDDDYPCCELVTSFRRGRNQDRYHKHDTTLFRRVFFMIMCNPQLNQYKDNIQTYIYI